MKSTKLFALVLAVLMVFVMSSGAMAASVLQDRKSVV